MTCNIGYIDDEDAVLEKYQNQIRRKDSDLNLLFVENCSSKHDVYIWILENKIKCMLIDHRLVGKYGFNGAELLFYLKEMLPGLPTIVFTSVANEARDTKLVADSEIMDRTREFSSDGSIRNLVEKINQFCKVYSGRLAHLKNEYQELFGKRETLSSSEMEYLKRLHRQLVAYGYVDDVPADLLDSNILKSIESLIRKIDDITANRKL